MMTRRTDSFVLTLLVAVALMAGCGKGSLLPRLGEDGRRLPQALLLADSLMNSRPDSALAVLEGAEGQMAGEHQWRQWQLLRLNAINKLDTLFTAAHVAHAQTLADYFDHHGNANERMLAHYLLGRTYYDTHEAPMALHCYQEAINCADTTASDCDFALLSRVNGQAAYIFYQQGLYRDMIEYCDLSTKYGLLGKDTLNALISYAKKASAYEQLQLKDSAIFIYEDAISKLKTHHYHNVAANFAGVLANILIDKGDIEKAAIYLKEHEHDSGYFDNNGEIEPGREIYYHFKGLYYFKQQQLDSAEYYFRKELHKGKDFNNQNGGALGLALLFRQKHKPDSADKYSAYSYAMNDSSYALKAQHEVEQAKAMYDYSRAQELALQQQMRADRQMIWLLVVGICALTLFLISGIIGVLLFFQRDKRRKAEQQYKEVKAKYEKTQLELKDLSDNGADTEKLIKEKIEEVANLQAELAKYEYLGKTLSGYAEQDEIVLLKKNEKYQSIIEKSDIGKAFSSEDWEKVDALLKEEYPNFHHYMTVKKESLSDYEYYICLLIRLYIPIKSCAHILGVDPSYVTKLRKQLHTKLFKGEGNSKSFDRLLRSISESSKEMGGE